MSSISVQSGINGTLSSPMFYYQKPNFKHLRTCCIPMKQRVLTLQLSTINLDNKSRPTRKIQRLSASATTEAVTEVTSAENSTSPTPEVSDPAQQTQKLEVVVKPVAKPRLVLKFIWMTKNIGLGLDQVIPGHGTIPLSPYYFWPRKDAWEELKTTLESKPWISQKKMILLLNQATDIINLWQQSGGNLSS